MDNGNSSACGTRRVSPALALLLAAIFATWGAQQVAIKIGNAEMAPLFQAGLRSAGATLFLTLWLVGRGRPPWRAGTGTWSAIALGALFTLDFGLLFLGLDRTAASRGTVLYYTGPVMIALGAGLLLPAERLRRLGLLGIALAFAGAVLVIAERSDGADGDLLGDVFCLAGAAAWAVTILLIKATRLVTVQAAAVLYWQLAGSALLLPLASLAAGETWTLPSSTAALSALAFQIVVVASTSYLLFFWLLQRHAAATLSAFSFLAPLFGVLFSALVLGETLTAVFAAGAALVLLGLAVVARAEAGPRAIDTDKSQL